ncbi:glycoside hydrolase family 43 protein [Chitinophaga sp. 22321]|uniref:Glycoside hydrolase family 43 protein n=1 Tax=Chitinophaga hostae TaxID=2831022 RepID=A0ABS5J756_9BACT|nr:glycoside hydrolase family 43 protein [Chitinophaga hostae]MBS0031054.1 glycoside hydrolase family 43 protein [Chitinophaga hostae]
MKKVFLFVLLLGLLNSVMAQDAVYIFSFFKDNGQDGLHLAYSRDGYTWKELNNGRSLLTPATGDDKLMRDPCIIRGADGLFHMVWTVSWKEKGIGYASSADLVHWSPQKSIPVMAHETGALNCWAPEITYDAAHKTYMIYWATTIPGRFAAGESSGDGKYNHRIYYVTTRDFVQFTPAKLLYDQGFNVIDASIVPDRRRFIMFLKDETRTPPQKNIRIATSKKLTGGYSKPSAPITGNYWAEGPTALKLGNKWIVYFDRYMQHRYGAVESTDLENWVDVSDKLSMPAGIRHGTVVTITGKEFEHLLHESGE